MLDLSFVRANLELVEAMLRDRGQDPAELLGNFRARDKDRRAQITVAEQLKAQHNKLSEQVGQLKKSGQDASAIVEETKTIKQKLEALELLATKSEEEMRKILEYVPNLPLPEVPFGKSEKENKEIKKWQPESGIRQFDFAPKPHWEIGEQLGILDLERAAKISGARFAVYWGEGARLERALINFMLDVHTREHGYTEVLPPFMVNTKSLFGTGQLPKFADDLFRCADKDEARQRDYKDINKDDREEWPKDIDDWAVFNDHWLIPTAEVPVTNLYSDETLENEELPKSLVAYTPCFRSEAGSYGKDVRGIIRQHQFQKVELVKFVRPEESENEHEKLTRDAEKILELLKLPYRRMLLCRGDMGFSAAKTYDLEVWLPGQNLYREISSCSNFGDFQARRARIRCWATVSVMDRGKLKLKKRFVHTLNGSGLAVGRTWLAIVENYQQADGSVRVPEALIPYMGGVTVIKRGEK